ncbi:hypothetical protein E2C01_007965 [Portunus trituberculatus]|uniref:Apple domain-containing protein n=1 Tax=Portunus trituberculatus TaxID=210409 RepID=A0A5B7D1U5_PORTR|nr:hypothetical protein [Portunus trituberculatus]
MVSTTVLRVIFLTVLLATVDAQRNRQKQKPARRRPGPLTRQDGLTPLIATCQGKESFELITGFVYSASAEDIIASRVGTLLLSECLDLCRANSLCKAINFETGLCVLFKSAVEERSGGWLCLID